MGSDWSNPPRAHDSRVKAMRQLRRHYARRRDLRRGLAAFKQIFMYMPASTTRRVRQDGGKDCTPLRLRPKVKCYSLMVLGEYDPLCH